MMNFLIFNIISLSALVISSRNPVYSILYLIMTFANTTVLLLLINVEFLALLFLVVYIGAIAILFLFVVMMLNLKITEDSFGIIFQDWKWFLGWGPLPGIVFILYYKNYIMPHNFIIDSYGYLEQSSNLKRFSNILYVDYSYLIIFISIVLFLAMVGVIILTLNQSFSTKTQSIYKQINTNFNKSIVSKRVIIKKNIYDSKNSW